MNEPISESLNQGANESMHFANLILQNCSGKPSWSENRTLESLAHFASFICQKCSGPFSFFAWCAKQSLEMQAELWLQSRVHFANFICEKCSDPFSFLRFWNTTAFSLQFRVHLADLIFQSAPNVIFFHILPTSCSKSAPTVSFFKHFEVQIKLSPQSCALFPTLCSKSAPASSAFYLKCKSSCHSPVHFLWTTFTARGPEPRKHAPYFGDASSHFTRKSTGFRVRKCFTREFTRFRTVTLPNYTWWWAVDMIMWLTWWWEC